MFAFWGEPFFWKSARFYLTYRLYRMLSVHWRTFKDRAHMQVDISLSLGVAVDCLITSAISWQLFQARQHSTPHAQYGFPWYCNSESRFLNMFTLGQPPVFFVVFSCTLLILAQSRRMFIIFPPGEWLIVSWHRLVVIIELITVSVLEGSKVAIADDTTVSHVPKYSSISGIFCSAKQAYV